MVMAAVSWCLRAAKRLSTLLPDWFGADPIQASIIWAGILLVCTGAVCEISAKLSALQSEAKLLVSLKFTALVLISIGTSVIASGIIFKVSQKENHFQSSLNKAGVLFVGDRNAFNEVIGWDNWITQTRRSSELIIIGKDQIKWAEESASSLGKVLNRGINITFIFQGAQWQSRLEAFWKCLTSQDVNQKFTAWRKSGKLKLCKYDQEEEYGYYWNGEKLVVKFYFVANKREAPFIVFDVSFAAGKFDSEDFSVASVDHIPFSDKKKMLVQAGANMCKIIAGSQLIPLA
jgi:hypothetical protein